MKVNKINLILFHQVVKYWPEKGKSGFIVWRYLFRRDDDNPAPWTSKGKKRSKELGITMQVSYSSCFDPCSTPCIIYF